MTATQTSIRSALSGLSAGAVTSSGSLPFVDSSWAVEFCLTHHGDLPIIASLPNRSPWESLLGQGVAGLSGVSIDADGLLRVNVRRLEAQCDIATDLDHDAFATTGLFLHEAVGRVRRVKLQMVGPITLGCALINAGCPRSLAFEIATRAVRERARALLRIVEQHLGAVAVLAVIDEPSLTSVMEPAFPVAPDVAIDMLSGALAAIEVNATAGVHCSAPADLSVLCGAGPRLMSVPVAAFESTQFGHLSQFLDGGGTVVWGAIPIDRPLGTSEQRWWRDLTDLWSRLEEAGCDGARLHHQSMIAPAGGLARYDAAQVNLIYSLCSAVGQRVAEQAASYRLPSGDETSAKPLGHGPRTDARDHR
jgi:hypothetical protein